VYLPLWSLSKIPPGPLYILTFGSAALLLLGALLMLLGSSSKNDEFLVVQRLGRNSFSIFLCQSFVYYTLAHLLLVHTAQETMRWAVLFWLASLAGIVWIGGLVERIGLTRTWTVALPYLIERWSVLRHKKSAVVTVVNG
jgi:peptidoglycan/LPS O-acetylase OafA/YrhL